MKDYRKLKNKWKGTNVLKQLKFEDKMKQKYAKAYSDFSNHIDEEFEKGELVPFDKKEVDSPVRPRTAPVRIEYFLL